MEERRKYERKPSAIRVEMHHPSFGLVVGSTKDISDGGAKVVLESDLVPPVGTTVSVLFRKLVSAINSEPVDMQVVHAHKNTLGLMFLPRA